MKQWTPRCSQQIKEIYDNLPNKGNAFLEQKLNRVYEQFCHKRKEDRNNLLQELLSLRSQVKPEIPEEKAKHQVNIKLTKENARKIEYLKKEGFTDSKLFEVLVLMDTLEISPIELSVEERKEAPQIAEAKRLEVQAPSEEKPLTIRKETINERIEKLMEHRHICYEDCFSEPFQDKSSRWMIDCPKPVFKKDRYNTWIPTGKIQGLISIETCLSKQGYRIRAQTRKELQEKERAKEEEVAEEEEAPQLLIPKIPELSIDQIVNQVGVCKNPFMIREARSLACAICKKRDPAKRQACDEILEELKMSPIAYKKFSEAMRESYKKKQEDWWQAPKTEDMTLEEIEKELGF